VPTPGERAWHDGISHQRQKAQIRPAEGAARLLEGRTGGQVSEVDDSEVVGFEYGAKAGLGRGVVPR
jgi:hypothetical protein